MRLPCLSPDTLPARARETGDRRRNEVFLDVFDRVRARYEQFLADEEALDFHGLINRAAGHIRQGRWKPKYRYVLVDEFQDISAGRMALLKALGRRDTAYFLVGDDWQSIYRFAGSDVRLVHECGDLLGHVQERTLSQTFRFGDGILEPSTAFVKRNPEQTPRPLRSASGLGKPGRHHCCRLHSRRGASRGRCRTSRHTQEESVGPFWCWGATARVERQSLRGDGAGRCKLRSAPFTGRRGVRLTT